jgi:hypothetical protein
VAKAFPVGLLIMCSVLFSLSTENYAHADWAPLSNPMVRPGSLRAPPDGRSRPLERNLREYGEDGYGEDVFTFIENETNFWIKRSFLKDRFPFFLCSATVSLLNSTARDYICDAVNRRIID